MMFLRMLLAFFLVGAAAAKAETKKDVLLIGVGGNSECIFQGGIRKLFRLGYETKSPKLDKIDLADDLLRLPNKRGQVASRYFSWTGDPIDDTNCLPQNPDWVLGGSNYILKQIHGALSGRKIVIVGWSNGGATAYELACLLTRKGVRVSLLVTLDAASWTTEPCASGGFALYPAKRWIGVYTKSNGLEKLASSNIIGLLGRAWNADFPSSARQRAHPLIKIEPAAHGDTVEMWGKCVLTSGAYSAWVRAEFGDPMNTHPIPLKYEDVDDANDMSCDPPR